MSLKPNPTLGDIQKNYPSSAGWFSKAVKFKSDRKIGNYENQIQFPYDRPNLLLIGV